MKYLKYLIIFLVVAGAGAGVYFSGILGTGQAENELAVDEHGNPIPKADVEQQQLYLAMDPPFVVNFTHRGTLHYLQLELDMMYHDQKTIDKIVNHMPNVRNDLILLFSNQEFEKLITAEGKEALRDEILLAVNNIAGVKADPLTGKTDGEVYITHFVMQ